MSTGKVLAGIIVVAAIVGGIVYSQRDGENRDRVVKIGHIQGAIVNLPEDVLRKSDFLEKRGVKYEFVNVASSNALYEAIVRGDVDISSLVSTLPVFINEPKQPGAVKIFSATNLSVEQKYDHILVKKDSPIVNLADISGKRLKYAVFPGTTHTAFTKQYLTSQGVDVSQIEFIQMPPTNHIAALESGAVDVLGTYDPMAGAALATQNYREIDYSVYAHVFDHTPLGVGIVNAKFLSEQPELSKQVAQAFQDAYQKMVDDKEFTYKTVAEVYNINPVIARQILIPVYATQLNYDSQRLQDLANYMEQIKEIPAKIDTRAMSVKL